MLVLKPIIWLKEVIPAIGDIIPLVQSTLLTYVQGEKVVGISLLGHVAWHHRFRCILKKTAVEGCLKVFEEHGFFLPDYNYFRIKSLDKGEEDLASISERLAQFDEYDMV